MCYRQGRKSKTNDSGANSHVFVIRPFYHQILIRLEPMHQAWILTERGKFETGSERQLLVSPVIEEQWE